MKVCVIGDRILDVYIEGTVQRISPEAPIPIVKKERSYTIEGGATNLYNNLKALGVDVDFFEFKDHLESIKTRIISNNTHVARYDDDFHYGGSKALEQIQKANFSQYDYVILSDYDKGTLNEAQQIIKHINQFGCKVIVDPKRNFKEYEGAWLVKPNYKEYFDFDFSFWDGNIITTNGGGLVVAYTPGLGAIMFEVDQVKVSDVTGAGDCFLAGLVYGLVNNRTLNKSIELAIKAGSKAVQNFGTYVLKKDDIDKIIFTNGCFDILHPGHVHLLQKAKELGTKLVVGLNSDESIRRLKGPTRPINDQKTRAKNLEALGLAYEVVIFDEDTPYELIQKLKPDVIVKGDDYTKDQVIGHDLAKVVLIPQLNGFSTTNIVEKINAIVR